MARKRQPREDKTAQHPRKRLKANAPAPAVPSATDLKVVLGLIEAAQRARVAAVNTDLIDLYWSIGEHISRKIASDGWGQGTVEALAEHIRRHHANARGFSAQNLWRMRQFYETYRRPAKTLSTAERIDLDPQPADPGQVQAR